MSVSWCNQDGCMMNLTKASNILCALLVLHGASARVCVCVGGGGWHCHEATRNTLANG